jgi:hypothetical protein
MSLCPKFNYAFVAKLKWLNRILSSRDAHAYIMQCFNSSSTTGQHDIHPVAGGIQVSVSGHSKSFWMNGFRNEFYPKPKEDTFISCQEMMENLSPVVTGHDTGRLKFHRITVFCKDLEQEMSQQSCHLDCSTCPGMGNVQELIGTLLLGEKQPNICYWDMKDVGIFVGKQDFLNPKYGWSDCPSSLIDKLVGNETVLQYGRLLFAQREQMFQQSVSPQHQVTIFPGYTPYCCPYIPPKKHWNVLSWSYCSQSFTKVQTYGKYYMSRQGLIFTLLMEEWTKLNWLEKRFLMKKGFLYHLEAKAMNNVDTTYQLDPKVESYLNRLRENHVSLLKQWFDQLKAVQNAQNAIDQRQSWFETSIACKVEKLLDDLDMAED